jgi:hypothetical protein
VRIKACIMVPMLNPIEVPLPLAVAIVAFLTYAAVTARGFTATAPPRPVGRHRLGIVTDPTDWATVSAALAAERVAQQSAQQAINAYMSEAIDDLTAELVPA